MDWKSINNQYIEMLKSDPKGYYEDYLETKEKVKDSTAIYKGEPVPFLYHPMFFTEEDIENFKKISDTLISISDKITEKYLTSSKFRDKFKYPKKLEELILIDNGYDINVPIGRFDLFYKDRENFKFCELNTDGSSAMNEDNTLAGIILDSKAMDDFGSRYEFTNLELIDSWVDDIIEIYGKWNKKGDEKPNVAIVDFIESATSEEFKVFKSAFEKKGYRVIIEDPRNLSYRDGGLYSGDLKIDLVYRRIVTFELLDKWDEIPDFIEAYREGAFCSVGSIRSQLMHNKIIFKILHDRETLEFLSEGEKRFVEKHIPYTGLFTGGQKIYDRVLNYKDRYIMKPLDLNASRGVYAGRDMSQEEWERRLKESFNKDYIYQEFVTPFKREHVVFNDGELKVEEFGSILGLFLYSEKFAGLYTRVGKESIISGLTSYHTLPNLIVSEK